jgi:hypothetical protein
MTSSVGLMKFPLYGEKKVPNHHSDKKTDTKNIKKKQK